ncbi:hypothetical protein HY251_02820 [bacterium]|nr:hypothetical protein [bacterium]
MGRRLKLPREYAHAGPAGVLAAFDRDLDGTLATDLPESACVTGSTVLIAPHLAGKKTDDEADGDDSEPGEGDGDDSSKKRKRRKKS